MIRRKLILWALLFLCAHSFDLFAQSAPPTWEEFQSSNYFYSFQYGSNPDGMTSEDYLETLLTSAISGLARQIEVKVKETADLEKISKNGTSAISYSSSSTYTTDVKLNLVSTKTFFSKKDNIGYAIAYIDKSSASLFFKKEIEDKFSEAKRLYTNANDLLSLGYKEKSKKELTEAIKCFSMMDEAFYWLKLCGISSNDYTSLLEIRNDINVLVQQKIAQLGHDNAIYISCTADCFGSEYNQLEGIIKSKLYSEDRSFVSSRSSADWVITINASAREHNSVSYGSLSSYFCYVDATCKIYKVNTGQMIYEGAFSEKGGSTISYSESGKDAYTRIASKIIGAVEGKIE